MFEIHRGSSRVALIIGKVVFKFPRFKMYKDSPIGLRFFMRGLIANLSEMFTYINTERAPFLVPVFSIGLVNIQYFEVGEVPTEVELNTKVMSQLSKGARGLTAFMNAHDLYKNNWRKNHLGYRLIDYGDTIGNGAWPLSGFLLKYHKELTELTTPQNPN